MKTKAIAISHKIYRKPLRIVEKQMRELSIFPETEIRIYPEYPTGWMATVGANGNVYIFRSVNGEIQLEVKPFQGVGRNGCLI